jgi:alpha-methylacyl-CoA racemase
LVQETSAARGRSDQPGALSGFTILDCTRLLPGEYGSQFLADLGAEVIKVEIPVTGEYGREASYFGLINRRKLSITLDLQAPRGQRVFKQLVAQSDVVFESFRPGVMQRLGIDYESIRSLRPEIVFCSLSGFGQTGPYRRRPSHNLNFQGLTGSLQRSPDEEPTVPEIPVVDLAAGIFSALSIVAALHAARATGQGQHIDVAMSDLALSLNLINLSKVRLASAQLAGPGSAHPGEHSFGIYTTKDGRYLAAANVEKKFWDEFVTEIGLPHLAGRLGAEGAESRAVKAEIQAVLNTATLAEWEARFAGLEACVTPVLSVDEGVEDRHARVRDMVWHDEYGWGVAFPAVLSGTPAERGGPVPSPGEHSGELLSRLGYTPDEIEALRSDHII